MERLISPHRRLHVRPIIQQRTGDIIAWFAVNYPGVEVKVVEGKTPDEVAGKVRGVLGV